MDQNTGVTPDNAAETLVPAEALEAAEAQDAAAQDKRNGRRDGSEHEDDLDDLLGALQIMRTGDFSVRLPGNRVGVVGKIADTFNEIAAGNQRMAQQLERVGQLVGR